MDRRESRAWFEGGVGGVGVGQRSSRSDVFSGNNYPVGLPSARLGLEKIE